MSTYLPKSKRKTYNPCVREKRKIYILLKFVINLDQVIPNFNLFNPPHVEGIIRYPAVSRTRNQQQTAGLYKRPSLTQRVRRSLSLKQPVSLLNSTHATTWRFYTSFNRMIQY